MTFLNSDITEFSQPQPYDEMVLVTEYDGLLKTSNSLCVCDVWPELASIILL